MRRLIRYIIILIQANLAIVSQYRANFFSGSISSLMWVFLAVMSIMILTYQSSEIGGWNRFELLVAQGVYSIVIAATQVLFGENIKDLGRRIRYGLLDNVFAKPIDSQLQVSIGYFRLYQLIRVLTGLLIIWYALAQLHIKLAMNELFLFAVFTIASMVIVYSFWFTLTTLNFWFTDLFNIYDLMLNVTGVARYPLVILEQLNKYFVYVLLPLVVISSVPAQIVTRQTNSVLAFGSLVTAAGIFFVSRRFWKYALKHYTSASS